jgi:hypothetical protein
MASLINLDEMQAAGFNYTSRRDTTRCAICELEISHWTNDMNPFAVHAERSPHCSFVRSIQSRKHFQGSPLSVTDSSSRKD